MNKKDDIQPLINTGRKTVNFTHLDKIFWQDERYTKGDVIDYYNTIYPFIIKYMKGRPESLRRQPNGINDKGFFQKDAGLSGPDWLSSVPLYAASAGV